MCVEWPVGGDVVRGRPWLRALELLREYSLRYPVTALVGRAGMGKTTVLRAFCRAVPRCVYVDASQLRGRSLSDFAYSAASAVVPGLARGFRGMLRRSMLIRAFRAWGYAGLEAVSSKSPIWVLEELGRLLGGRLIVAVDEALTGFGDARIGELRDSLIAVRNSAKGFALVVALLPEAFEELVSHSPQLGAVLGTSMVQLPDALSVDDLADALSVHCNGYARELAERVLSVKPDATVRDALLMAKQSVEAVIPVE